MSERKKTVSSKNEIALVFTGDIGFDRYMNGKWNDPELISEPILDFLHSASHVIANVEGALIKVAPGYDPTGRGIFCHPMDPEAVRVLNKMGADIWNYANNHTMDMAEEGMKNSLAAARENGAQVIGSGMNIKEASKPLFLEDAGGIGMFAVGAQPICVPATDTTAGCMPWNDMQLIRETIENIKKTCRWCIVVAHGGEEFQNLPAPYVRQRYIDFLEMGADIVVSHHPHVVMNYELFSNKAIFYSLGNFIFDTDYQRVHHNTDRGVLLRLRLDENGYSFDTMATRIVRGVEHIEETSLPAIFTDINSEEYEKLIPLSAKVFLEAEKKRRIFMDSAKYSSYEVDDWRRLFHSKTLEKSIPGQQLDLAVLDDLASCEKDGAWKTSTLTAVVKYLLEQL